MKNFTKLSLLIASLFVVVNCSPKNSSNGNVGVSATAFGVCPAGQWYSNGQCFGGDGSGGPAGYNLSNGFYGDNYSYNGASFQITNPTLMKQFFKLAMGVCDRGDSNYQNIGSSNCDAYISGYRDIILQLPQSGNTGAALITVIAKPYVDPYYNYYGQLPSGMGLLGVALGYFTGIYIPDPSYYTGAYRNPLQIQAELSPINNNQGFEARGYGDAWTGANQTFIQVQVENGSVTSSSLSYKLLVQGQEAARGTMQRCQYQNCGM
jgi:hypothetical protein